MTTEHNDEVMRSHIADTKAAFREAFPEERDLDVLWWVLWDRFGYWYLAQDGATLRGFSFSQKLDEWLLCIRVDRDVGAQVGFMSGSTTTSCVRKVLAALEQGLMKWYDDRFA